LFTVVSDDELDIDMLDEFAKGIHELESCQEGGE
jgi:hypothetical protein